MRPTRKSTTQRPDAKLRRKSHASCPNIRSRLTFCDLPPGQQPIDSPEDAALSECLRKLRRGLRRRTEHFKQPAYQKPGNNAAGYLLKEAYRQTLKLLRQGKFDALRNAVPPTFRPKGKLAEIPFAWFLSLYFGRDGDIPKATRNRIRLHAIALSYAHQHNVPSKFVVGYILQVGGQKALAKEYVAAGKTRTRRAPKPTR